jgi:hypothetical protein
VRVTRVSASPSARERATWGVGWSGGGAGGEGTRHRAALQAAPERQIVTSERAGQGRRRSMYLRHVRWVVAKAADRAILRQRLVEERGTWPGHGRRCADLRIRADRGARTQTRALVAALFECRNRPLSWAVDDLDAGRALVECARARRPHRVRAQGTPCARSRVPIATSHRDAGRFAAHSPGRRGAPSADRRPSRA